MARRANPQIQTPRLFSREARNLSSEEFLRQLEEQLKLNRGGFNTGAEDTDADVGYIVPGTRFSGAYLPEVIGNRRFEPPAPPVYPEIPQFEPYDPYFRTENLPSGNVLGAVDPGSAEGFFTSVARSLYNPGMPTTEELYQRSLQTGEAYPVQQRTDGTILWSDGTIRSPESIAPPTPVATMADGNVLWSDGYVRGPLPSYVVDALTGTSALSQGLFGTDQTITQEYGAYNPIEPTPGNINLGTDFRVRDLADMAIRNYFDMPLRVIQSYSQAEPGSGSVGNMENQGYGNSLLLQLPDGSMIRVSHLDYNPWNAGDTINPGDFIGIPGATGNVTGAHTDVEVYDPSGNIMSPDQFLANVRNQAITQTQPLYSYNDLYNQQSQEQSTEPSLLNTVQAARDAGGSIIEAITEPVQQVQAALEPYSPQRQQLASGVQDIAEGGDLQAEFGLSELTESGDPALARQARISALSQQPKEYNPYRMLAGNISERVGDIFNLDEGSFSETIAGGPTRKTSEDITNQIGMYPGLDRTTVPGIRQNIADIIADVRQGAPQGREFQRQGSEVLYGGLGRALNIPEVYASEVAGGVINPGQAASKLIEENKPTGENIDFGISELLRGDVSGAKGIFEDTFRRGVSKAGEGLKRLIGEGAGSPVNLFTKRDLSDLAPGRIVGDSAGGNLLPSPTVAQASARLRRDTTDPFFKTDLFERLKGFSTFEGGKPGKDQALNLDVFTDAFYGQPERVASVFGDTFLRTPALGRAREQIAEAFRNKYAGRDYDQADVERIINQLPADLNYTPNLPVPKRSEEYIRRQRAINEAVSSGSSRTSSGNTVQNYTPSNANMTDAATGLPVKSSYTPKYQPQPRYTGGQSKVSGEIIGGQSNLMTQTPTQQSSPSIFDRAASFASGIFRRFFN